MEAQTNTMMSSSSYKRKLGGDEDDENAAVRAWSHPASRIFRVSRATGGKDRHSKVYTSKGLRDRRVRLSVSTAIQFYDLQDRLGYDQPSKAIEWLIKSAAAAINELPSLDSSFITNQNSSASETSKGSVLSLSRTESRVKARERARERTTAKDSSPVTQNLSSFTELLTGGGAAQKNVFSNQDSGLFSHHGGSMLQHPSEMQQIALLPQENFFPGGGGENYNLNFSISQGFHRGTLQSNSHHHHHQRLSSPLEGTGAIPFLFGSAVTNNEGQYAAGFDGHLYKHLQLEGKGKN